MSASTDLVPLSVPNLKGKVYLVTGGNAGMYVLFYTLFPFMKLTLLSGLETAFQLAYQHAKVYIGCRSNSKGLAAISTIKLRVPGADIHLLIMDLTDLASVVRAAKEFVK